MATAGSSYSGPERRQRRVFVTHNTEYHTRGGICVAVSDRRSGEWLADHPALGHKVLGFLRRLPNGELVPDLSGPEVGDAVWIEQGARGLITSAIERVDRPAREVIERYPAS